MKISCMVVDDQTQTLELLRDHIDRVPWLQLEYAGTNSVEALTFLDTNQVDCIFLDIEMPELSGLDFIKALKEKSGQNMPKIILTTGYDRYALSGYDYGVFDYLLKPVSFSRFKISVDRLCSAFKTSGEENNFLFVDLDSKKVKIQLEDICYIEGAKNYVYLITPERKMTLYKSMSSIQETLPSNRFIRVHKSFIVPISKIEAVRGNEIFVSANNSQKIIPIGGTYKENLLKVLKIAE